MDDVHRGPACEGSSRARLPVRVLQTELSTRREDDVRMTPEDVIQMLTAEYPGLVPKATWGETSLFYNPGGALKNGVYFATVKERDGDHDQSSRLNRDGVFRVSFGLPTAVYEAVFGPRPPRPPKGQAVVTGHDFTVLDQLAPHPVYAWMGWVQVLSPTEQTLGELQPLLAAAYGKARGAFDQRTGRSSG